MVDFNVSILVVHSFYLYIYINIKYKKVFLEKNIEEIQMSLNKKYKIIVDESYHLVHCGKINNTRAM